MELRIATAEDLTALIAVQREVQDLHVRWYPQHYRSAQNEELLQAMREFLQTENVRVWVAVAEGIAAGCLVFRIDASPESVFCRARKEGVVDQMSVLARFQRQGIGGALMAEAARYAKSQGCDELRLSVLAANTAAREFYEFLGFTPIVQRMRKAL
jgi:diamine N-acetyltransferase